MTDSLPQGLEQYAVSVWNVHDKKHRMRMLEDGGYRSLLVDYIMVDGDMSREDAERAVVFLPLDADDQIEHLAEFRIEEMADYVADAWRVICMGALLNYCEEWLEK